MDLIILVLLYLNPTINKNKQPPLCHFCILLGLWAHVFPPYSIFLNKIVMEMKNVKLKETKNLICGEVNVTFTKH